MNIKCPVFVINLVRLPSVCSVNLLDESLSKTTKYREIVQESLASPLLPKISLQFKWEPPSEEICASSVAKYFDDRGFVVEDCAVQLKCHAELSRRLASFSDLKEDTQEVLEYLGMLALDCTQSADEYLNSYEYSGDMLRVRSLLVIKAKGCFNAADLQGVIEEAMYVEGKWKTIVDVK